MNSLKPFEQNTLDILRAKVYFWAQYLNKIKVRSKHGDDYLNLSPIFKIEDLDSDLIEVESYIEKDKEKCFSVTIKLQKVLRLNHITYNFDEEALYFTFPKIFFTKRTTDTKKQTVDEYTYPTSIYFDISENSQDAVMFDLFTSLYLNLNVKHFYLSTTNFKEIGLVNELEYQKIKISLHDPFGNLKIPNNCNPNELIFLLSYHPTLNNHKNTYGFVALSNSNITCFNITQRFLNPQIFDDLRV